MNSSTGYDVNGKTGGKMRPHGESLERVLEPSDFMSTGSPGLVLRRPEAHRQPDLPFGNDR
jgi:hypothetical protein